MPESAVMVHAIGRESSAREMTVITRNRELSEFSQTLQTTMGSSAIESSPAAHVNSKEPNQYDTVVSVLNSAEPPALWHELTDSIRETIYPHGRRPSSPFICLVSVLQALFPVLQWGRSYNLKMLMSDLMAGLTLASLGIPQSIGYATLARLNPQYGLYTSVVPPLVYALMGSSREVAIGPVAVVSLLLSSMIQKQVDPLADPISYKKLVFTATFFAGIFQAAFGFLRLGFLVEFLSHAALVGFIGGAAIVIGLQQLKGLFGISHFTNNTDMVSVVKSVWEAIHEPWLPYNFLIGCSFLIFILITRFLSRRNKKLFWLSAIAPLLSIILSTLLVYVTRADNHGVKIIKHIKGGMNPSSAKQLQFSGPFVGEAAKIGLICAIIALTEAIAVGQSFASVKGYQLDGNKEMVAMGFMNIFGSLSSCYVATGSFSRTAINFSAGCKSTVSNIVMAITVFTTLEFLTGLFYYTPNAILASIILSALPGLIHVREAYNIWEVDKLDFLVCMGAFFGVLFGSVEIGLLAAVIISFSRTILNSIRSRVEVLGRIRATDNFCSIKQYPVAIQMPHLLIIRIGASFLCFINAKFVKERIMRLVIQEQEKTIESPGDRIQALIIDMSNVMNIDTSGLIVLEEIHKNLVSQGLQIAIANPGWQVIEKIKLAKLVDKIGEWLFLTVAEAVEACLKSKDINTNG